MKKTNDCHPATFTFPGTTIITNDQQGPQLSKVLESKDEHHLIVHYGNGAALNQVVGLVDVSETCEQYISVECHHSPIFSDQGLEITWWNSRNGTKMTNWGTPTGVDGCVCSQTRSKIHFSPRNTLIEYTKIRS